MAKINNNSESKKIRRIVMALVAIFILLLTVRSCSKEFNWTIGKIFGTESHHEINSENANDDAIILNKNLYFDIKEDSITLDTKEHKISFTYEYINPEEFTCSTSDANIATCYVKDNYVVINPKNTGEVVIYVQTKTNNKVYKGSTKLNITESNGSLNISSTNGTMILDKTNQIILTYNLNNIKGDVSVKSSDESIATVTISNGVIIVTGKKPGIVKVSLTVVDKETNKTYNVTYDVVIKETLNDLNNSGNNQENSSNSINNENVNDSNDNNDNNTGNGGNTDNDDTNNKEENDKPVSVKDNNNYLEFIKVYSLTLTPEFNKNTLNYNVNVENDVKDIGFLVKKDSKKSSIKYIYNNNTVTDISDLSLNVGDNILKIKVTAENKEVRTYTIIINRKEEVIDPTSTYLKDLTIDGYELTPAFNKDISFYSLNVAYDQPSISLNFALENPYTTVNFRFNDEEITDLSNIILEDGDNQLIIEITTRTRSVRIYIINIHKPVRTIEFSNNYHKVFIEQSPYNISYKVLEDNLEINNYEFDDIKVNIDNFDGTYTIHKGYIKFSPTYSDIDKKLTLKINYNNKTSMTNLYITTNEYYINTPALEYDMNFVNNTGNKKIIINNNILVGDITKTIIPNGFRLSTSNTGYIDVVSNDNLIDIDFGSDNSSNNSIILSVIAKSKGESSFTITGNIFGKELKKYTVKLNIIEKYNVVIDANGGFFDSFTDKYTYLLTKNEKIDLSELTALKLADEVNCLFYELDSFNTINDGTGIKYEKDDIVTNFDKDLTLYAVYSSESKHHTLAQTERLYLTEIDLFHNEDYYEKYNVDKIIYPGSEGAHVMTITNKGIGKIKIKSINLEEDTICISNRQCLNIGYIIKSALDVNDRYTYFYGTNNSYTILNKDAKTTYSYGTLTGYHTLNNIEINPNIEIDVDETKEISLLWKWVSVDDELDTYIGNNISSLEDTYSLTISIDFVRESNTCTLP